jgi:hypothetical protein
MFTCSVHRLYFFNKLNFSLHKGSNIPTKNVFSQIKFKKVHQERFFADHFLDVYGAQQSFAVSTLQLSINDKVQGFVQETKLNPYGFLLFSQIQVEFFFEFKIFII